MYYNAEYSHSQGGFLNPNHSAKATSGGSRAGVRPVLHRRTLSPPEPGEPNHLTKIINKITLQIAH